VDVAEFRERDASRIGVAVAALPQNFRTPLEVKCNLLVDFTLGSAVVGAQRASDLSSIAHRQRGSHSVASSTRKRLVVYRASRLASARSSARPVVVRRY
jgi:hypothetical protein